MDKRTILAVSLSLFVLIAWTFLFPKNEAIKAPVAVEQSAPATVPVNQVETTATPAQQAPTAYAPSASTQANDVTVETDLYKAVFTTQGAILKYWELKTHQINDIPVILLKSPGIMPPLSVIFESPDRNLPQRFVYEANTSNINLSGKGKAQGELIFTYSDGNMKIAKHLMFHNDGYNVDLSIETQNTPSFKLPV